MMHSKQVKKLLLITFLLTQQCHAFEDDQTVTEFPWKTSMAMQGGSKSFAERSE